MFLTYVKQMRIALECFSGFCSNGSTMWCRTVQQSRMLFRFLFQCECSVVSNSSARLNQYGCSANTNKTVLVLALALAFVLVLAFVLFLAFVLALVLAFVFVQYRCSANTNKTVLILALAFVLAFVFALAFVDCLFGWLDFD
jgi:hypothetical protein